MLSLSRHLEKKGEALTAPKVEISEAIADIRIIGEISVTTMGVLRNAEANNKNGRKGENEEDLSRFTLERVRDSEMVKKQIQDKSQAANESVFQPKPKTDNMLKSFSLFDNQGSMLNKWKDKLDIQKQTKSNKSR